MLAQDTATCETGFHLVTHMLGESCVSDKPQRVFTIDMSIMELLL